MKKEKINLGTKTIQQLQNYIKKQNLKVGDKLPTENELMKILHVGRSTLREAIKILAYSGIVEVKQGSGTFISKNIKTQINDKQLWSLQKMLETEGIQELTKMDVSDSDWLLLKAKLARRNQLLQEGKFTEYLDADVIFHQMIIKLTRNEYLIDWYQEISSYWLERLSKHLISSEEYDGNTKLHNTLFEQLINRDSKAAIKTIHLIGGKELISHEN